MAEPVLLVLDDEEVDLRCATRELESRYAAHDQIVSSVGATRVTNGQTFVGHNAKLPHGTGVIARTGPVTKVHHPRSTSAMSTAAAWRFLRALRVLGRPRLPTRHGRSTCSRTRTVRTFAGLLHSTG